MLTVASNPGHLLWSGIVPPERAARVVARLMAAGHELGLGHPHAVGAASRVQSVFLSERLGLAARQQPDRARLQALWLRRARSARSPATSPCGRPLPAQPAAGTLCRHAARRAPIFPVQYLGANVPQAWAAGSAFALLQAILGILPDAPRGRIYTSIPHLPAWLPDVTLLDLRLGQRSVRHPLLARGREHAVRGLAWGSACGGNP